MIVYEKVDLSEHQIKKIRLYLSNDGRLIRAVGSTITRKRKSARARALVAGNHVLMQKAVREKLNQLTLEQREWLNKKICEEFDYCNNNKDPKFVTGMVGAIWALFEPISGGIALIVFMIKFRVLDDFCECE